MIEWLTEFTEKHQGAFLGAIFSLVAFLFLRWANSRPPHLSAGTRKLLKKLKSDATHDAKGITIYRWNNMVSYWPFRLLESDNVKPGMFYELSGESLEAVQGVEELLAKGYLTVEHESEGGLTVYRLKD